MEALQIEAIRGCMSNMGVNAVNGANASNSLQGADPAAVAKFRELMTEPVAVDRVDVGETVRMPIPFAERVAASFRDQEMKYQRHLSVIEEILRNEDGSMPSQLDLMRLQYEVDAMSFQQSVVSKVIESASSAIQTLVKNS